MSDIRYRHWQPGDDEGVWRILGPMGWCSAESYAAKFDDSGLRPEDVLIAERDGQVVGHLMLPHRRLRFGQATLPLGGIGMVVVDAEARGQGVGAGLLERALAHHRAAGNALAGLNTQVTLVPAYEMYRRRGFVSVTRRVILHLPVAALGTPPADLRARPATEDDRIGVARLIDAWAAQHRGVSVEAAAERLDGQQVVVRPDGTIVGRLELSDGPSGRQARRLLVDAAVGVSAVLAAALADHGLEEVQVVTNTGNRAYAELAPRATREDEDISTLMLAPLVLVRVLAGLAIEVADALRRAGAAPIETTLTLAETSERVRLDWRGQVLTVDGRAADDAFIVPITTEAVIHGLVGQPGAPPDPALAPLWSALFPQRGVEMRLLDTW